MRRIYVKVNPKNHSYYILIDRGLLQRVGNFIRDLNPSLVIILSDYNVFSLYGDTLKKSLLSADIKHATILIPPGEESKNIFEVAKIYEKILKEGGDRESVIVNLGGGVVGDIGGFVSSTFMRGIRYVHIPTTLMAQVDSSIGGKVGVNISLGKNIVGSFHHPMMVLTDPNVLNTLPYKEFANGMAEVIKASIIASKNLFSLVESLPTALEKAYSNLEDIIYQSVQIKSEIVNKDVFEKGERKKLNLGHTFAHAIESATGYNKLTHGEAVSIGLVGACVMSDLLKLSKESDLVARVEKVLRKFNLPTKAKGVSVEKVKKIMEYDKKKSFGKLKFILPTKVGEVKIVENIKEDVLKEVLKYILA